MSLSEKLLDFAGGLSVAITDAPDNYPDWGYTTYEQNMADIREEWAYIKPRLKRDLDKAAFIDQKLAEMFQAYDEGNKAVGKAAALAIYNSEVKKLR